MFVGHYGVSFAAQGRDRRVPLWVLFIAVQLLDVIWAPFILLGIEKVRIVPGITASNPLDLYYMPYTHSLIAAILWSAAATLIYRLWRGAAGSMTVGLAVFSHWILDFVVHRPDLPLYDNTAKVGLGLWNQPALALGLETVLLFGGMWLCVRDRRRSKGLMVIFGVVMLSVQSVVFFGPPPPSGSAAAMTALMAYALFAAFVAWWERRSSAPTNALALVVLVSLGTSALDVAAQVPGTAHGGREMSTSRVVSPAVVASWVSRENFADGSTTTLLVLWRGTPGWFSKGRGGSSGGGGSGAVGGTSSGYVYVSEGGLYFVMEFDYDKRIVKILEQEISLKETNVVLVDFVDGTTGPAIVGYRWVDPTPPEEPASIDPIAPVIKRAPELFEYLQCDLTLADPVMKKMMPIICGQLRP